MIFFNELLLSLIITCSIAVFLAILMVIADNTIANYSDVIININNDKEYTAEGGNPLLGTLKSQGIFIPSACGGRGSCGLCKVKVKEGAGDYLATELPWIEEDEIKDNIRLSCQLKVKKNFKIEIPDELFNIKEYKTEVIDIKDLTYDIKQITLKLLEPFKIKFTAGQFIQFEVPSYDLTDEPVYRAYSIASSPDQENIIELEIRYVPDGICTTYVHKYLKPGEKVNVNGPYGKFHLQKSQRDIIFIAGGSGMAPIKSILNDIQNKNINRKIEYFFGALTKKDLFLIDEMNSLESKLSAFKFIPALSNAGSDGKWNGETGLITEVVNRFLQNADNKEAYLCGSPGMIDACIKVLTNKGIPDDLIYYDKFA